MNVLRIIKNDRSFVNQDYRSTIYKAISGTRLNNRIPILYIDIPA
jgi:hypothetical protein